MITSTPFAVNAGRGSACYFAAQRALGNEKAAEELENAYVEIMTSQRSFDMGPGLQPDGKPSPYAMEGFGDRVGKCTFEKDEYRAPKATYTAELFVALAENKSYEADR